MNNFWQPGNPFPSSSQKKPVQKPALHESTAVAPGIPQKIAAFYTPHKVMTLAAQIGAITTALSVVAPLNYITARLATPPAPDANSASKGTTLLSVVSKLQQNPLDAYAGATGTMKRVTKANLVRGGIADSTLGSFDNPHNPAAILSSAVAVSATETALTYNTESKSEQGKYPNIHRNGPRFPFLTPGALWMRNFGSAIPFSLAIASGMNSNTTIPDRQTSDTIDIANAFGRGAIFGALFSPLHVMFTRANFGFSLDPRNVDPKTFVRTAVSRSLVIGTNTAAATIGAKIVNRHGIAKDTQWPGWESTRESLQYAPNNAQPQPPTNWTEHLERTAQHVDPFNSPVL
jgi:hypothetical protein